MITKNVCVCAEERGGGGSCNHSWIHCTLFCMILEWMHICTPVQLPACTSAVCFILSCSSLCLFLCTRWRVQHIAYMFLLLGFRWDDEWCLHWVCCWPLFISEAWRYGARCSSPPVRCDSPPDSGRHGGCLHAAPDRPFCKIWVLHLRIQRPTTPPIMRTSCRHVLAKWSRVLAGSMLSSVRIQYNTIQYNFMQYNFIVPVGNFIWQQIRTWQA